MRAVAALGVIDDYLDAGFGYDHFVEVYTSRTARPGGPKIPVQPRLVEKYPVPCLASVDPHCRRFLGDRAIG